MTRLRRLLAATAAQAAREGYAALHDARHRRVDSRILVLRDRHGFATYNDDFLAWVRGRAPEVWPRFELRYHPRPVRDLAGVSLLVPWLQDPLRERFPQTFVAASALERRCEARGIGVVNPVANLSRAIKSTAAELIRQTGVRTPRMHRIADAGAFRRDHGGLALPFFIREDQRHGGPVILVTTADDLRAVSLSRFEHPVAVEFIDVRSGDGLYRKWRYVAVGDRGCNRHMVASERWIVHAGDRVLTPAILDEERAYVTSDDPNQDALQRARRALGLDVVAFDYSYDHDGRLVIWEPNPFPVLVARYNRDRADLQYQVPTIERLYRLLLDDLLERAARLPA